MARTLNDRLSKASKEHRERVEKRAKELISQEMTLQELRKARQMSQQTVATILHVQQGEISKMERRTDMYISTLRSFVQAMGGSLDIIVRFPNHPAVKITQFEEEGEAPGFEYLREAQ